MPAFFAIFAAYLVSEPEHPDIVARFCACLQHLLWKGSGASQVC